MNDKKQQHEKPKGDGPMYVIKRDGRRERVQFDKITSRIKKLCYCLDEDYVDPVVITQKVCQGLYRGMFTYELDELAAETAAHLTTKHADWGILAARLCVSNLHKETSKSFYETMKKLHEYRHKWNGELAPMISDETWDIIEKYNERLSPAIIYDRDNSYDYFGFKTLENGYLLKIDGRVVERPQHMLMRVSIGIHGDDIEGILQTYNLMSTKWFTHATPTLFNSGTEKPQMSSCFLLTMKEDSISGIFDTLSKCAEISKFAGGIGLSAHKIRASGSYIHGTNGHSNGIVPMMRCFNNVARYVDQCFATDTLVRVKDGGWKPIQEVGEGSLIMTARGTFERVEKQLVHEYAGNILRIHVGGFVTAVTPEHQVLAVTGAAQISRIRDGINEPPSAATAAKMVDASELRVGHLMCMPSEAYIGGDGEPTGAAMLADDGNYYFPISNIEVEEDCKRNMYDFEVENEHTYVTQMGSVHNGGGKRKGSFAFYLEPWHADILAFLDLKKNHGKDEDRARDLFYGLWVPDLFMKRVDTDGDWSLFCPNEAPGLPDCYGAEFDALYERYEKEGRARKTIKARKLWEEILKTQTETGTPYLMFKDACNRKSNQKNLGTIRSSNLCCEIIEYTAPDEVAVCNLASIALPKFVNMETKEFDHQRLFEVTQVVTRNLNRVIDRSFYPVPEARKSNMRHRPLGIGVQGLADTFMMLRMTFTCPEAKKLNREIFETIYFAACSASKDLAVRDGPYESFAGSPASEGLLQFDLWDADTEEAEKKTQFSGRWDWATLKAEIREHGMRNSLLVAPMPTASTAQILGNIEAFEPLNMNVYVRRTLAGEFVCVVRHLMTHLIELKLWDESVRNQMIADGGSIQNIASIPADVKALYRTVYEISGRDIIDMAADRGRFIDQSQSMNVHIADINYGKLTTNHFRAWRAGLKSGCYYVRSKAAASAIQFTVDTKGLRTAAEAAAAAEPEPEPEPEPSESEVYEESSPPTTVRKSGGGGDVPEELVSMLCSLENREECLSCGS